MFRTRDFVLIFTVIVFLLTAIGATVFLGDANSAKTSNIDQQRFSDQLANASDQEYSAVIATKEGLTRVERVAQMRKKIADQAELSAPEVRADTDKADGFQQLVEATTTEEQVLAFGLQQCPRFSPYLGFWDARDLSVVESEGAILVIRTDVQSSGSSTDTTVLQLPTRIAAAPDQSCIGSDVVGIANDGSLIRNDEASVYRIFGSVTIVGYALDGFPIYGGTTGQTDTCGGVSTAGQYAYYLNPERETVINCFAAAPIALP